MWCGLEELYRLESFRVIIVICTLVYMALDESSCLIEI